MEIQRDFIKMRPEGLYCPAGFFFLDPQRPVSHAIISHAHADHAVPGNRNVYCSGATAFLLNQRYGSRAGGKISTFKFGEPFELNGVKITLYPAGHILGSSQVLMEYKGCRYLYTGDFKLQEDNTAEPFEFVKADMLITETTFASPDVSHPSVENEMQKLNVFSGKNILIGAYMLGKSQRLTSLINRYCTDKTVLVHSSIAAYHRVYEKRGMNLGAWQPYQRNLFKVFSNSIYLVPPYVFRKYAGNKDYMQAFATGWDKGFEHCDIDLRISDHADWNDILRLIKETEPRAILCVHGSGKHIETYFKGGPIEIISHSELQ
jgi:putative mRNA 3-end processing factor